MQTNQSEILDFEKLFSTSLQKKRGIGKKGLDICSVDTRNLKQIPLVILLFSAHWCPPCRGLLPLLKEFYRQVNLVDLEEMVKPQRALHEIFKQELPEYDAVARRIIDEYHCEAKPRMPLNCEIVLISLDTNPFQY
jgi:thiol-disulfide isomerase/thioredoxin